MKESPAKQPTKVREQMRESGERLMATELIRAVRAWKSAGKPRRR